MALNANEDENKEETKTLKPKKNESAGVDDDEEDDGKGNCMFIVFIVCIVALTILGIIDSLTTKYFKRMCVALAAWTMDKAPFSFIVFEFVIFVFVILCIPYGPLSVLSGALFYQKYKRAGIIIAFVSLVFVTFTAGCVAFWLAKNYLKETVKKNIKKSPKLKFLANLDKLIDAGQGLEMVVLIRIAPLPNGPTNYFLGTTSLEWKDFIVGSILIGMPECLLDVCIGAGAQEVDFSSPTSVILFVVLVAFFLIMICFIGHRAKKKLESLDTEAGGDKQLAE
mmetsp:Transcript_39459/g.79693  ORF Transcript_39459/g.79693 Transcript_39459/m.79693 type:complete len:281 (+) Transcript_39459:124-966(+)